MRNSERGQSQKLSLERVLQNLVANTTKMHCSASVQVNQGDGRWTKQQWIDFVEIPLVFFKYFRKWFAVVA